MTEKMNDLEKIAGRIRHHILTMTTEAGSGHPTSSLSAVELMTGLLFGGAFRYFIDNAGHPNNDRLIFSKGHASPLLYSLWAVAGLLPREDLKTYRRFDSSLEGHPVPRLPFVEAATGSLGQGLSVGVGMALNAKYLDRLPCRTYVLLGDSEMAEGSQWEAVQIAAHYKLNNLVGLLDVNRLGQRGETMYGHNLKAYADRMSAFGWRTVEIDGHSFPDVLGALMQAEADTEQPLMIIARTIKGKGVSFVENRDGWHGKTLVPEDLTRALEELGPVDLSVSGRIRPPADLHPSPKDTAPFEADTGYERGESVATRNGFGTALRRIYPAYPHIVSLDGEVSNSTRAKFFKEAYPDRFFEMFIAEQNMAGVALGMAARGKIPFVSTFGAFWTRALDQIRMARYSDANIKFVGSHAGVAIGEDGPSQMALEDIAMFRSIHEAAVLYPADAVSAERLVEAAAAHKGMVYIRTGRGATPVIYDNSETFPIGGAKVIRRSKKDVGTLVAAGITLHESLAAYEMLRKEGVPVRVIDLYSIQPLNEATLKQAAAETGFIITVEDHSPAGGIGEAVCSALADSGIRIYCLAVRKRPMSGKPVELLDYEGISTKAIVAKVMDLLGGK